MCKCVRSGEKPGLFLCAEKRKQNYTYEKYRYTYESWIEYKDGKKDNEI